MKINSSPSKSSGLSGIQQRQKSVAGYAQQSGRASNASSVDLSNTAKTLQSSEHDVNIERIQAIKAAIASGKLEVDTSKIADSLIASVRELLK